MPPLVDTYGSDRYIGLMSGTSADGVDAALVDFREHPPQIVATHFVPFPAALRCEALALNQPGANELDRGARFGIALAELYARAVSELLGSSAPGAIAIGCHGQTVRHRPDASYTVQLINPAVLAELTGMTVVADFRSRDLAAGGQGAPLVPPFHRMWFGHPAQDRVVVNIGGIANLTALPRTGAISGWDIGPGNCLLDYWVEKHCGTSYDAGGNWAQRGTVIESLLRRMLADPYFAKPPPKSTGRDEFNASWLERFPLAGHDAIDVQATLAELTAQSIALAITQQRLPVQQVFVCGGGAHNSDLMNRARRSLPAVQLDSTSALGLDPDWVEASAFAWLARCAVRGEPAGTPSVTGARAPRILGAIYPA